MDCFRELAEGKIPDQEIIITNHFGRTDPAAKDDVDANRKAWEQSE